jgi:hypothetical protein
MEAKNKERFERLRALAPIEAVKAWLDGDFGIDDEPAMISAIRKDPRISLSDDGIIDAVCEAMDEGLDAQACLEHFNKRCSRISR